MRFCKVSVLLALGAALAAGVASAAVVGVDVALNAYTGPGVLDTTSRTWETPADGGTFNLGGNTVTVTYVGSGVSFRAAGDIKLFEEMRFNGNGTEPVEVILSGLDASQRYNIVAYGADRYSGWNRGSNYEVLGSGLGFKATSGDSSTSFIENTNYVRFNNLTTSAGSLTLRATVGPEVAMLNGFEIESFTPSPTILQYGFDYTSGTVDGQGGSVVNDANPGTFDSVTIQGTGGAYSPDIPPGHLTQHVTGIGSLDVTGAAISTANSLGVGSGQGITTATDVHNAGGLTMEVWVKDIAATTGNPGFALSMGAMYALGVAPNGQVGFFPGDVSDLNWTTEHDTSSWTHLAVVMETDDPAALNYHTITAYVDGLPIHSGSHTFPLFLDRATSVGNHQFNIGWNPMDGLVYEPRITLGALSPSEFTYVPEPSTAVLLLIGGIALLPWVRRRK